MAGASCSLQAWQVPEGSLEDGCAGHSLLSRVPGLRLAQDGSMFKAQVDYHPYFYLHAKVGAVPPGRQSGTEGLQRAAPCACCAYFPALHAGCAASGFAALFSCHMCLAERSRDGGGLLAAAAV